MLLYQIFASTIHGKIQKSHTKTIKLKISASTWNEEFGLRDGSYSVLYSQDYFWYIIKKHEAVSDNSPVRIYMNEIENSITFRIKAGYYLEILTLKTIKIICKH